MSYKAEKVKFLQDEIERLEFELWKVGVASKAAEKSGQVERIKKCEAIAKQVTGEQRIYMDELKKINES